MLGSFFFFMVLPLQVCFQLLTANHTADESWFELDLFSDLFRHYVVILSSRHANFMTKKKILSLSGTKITAPRYVLPSELIQLGSIEFCSNNHCPSLSLLVCSVSFGIHGTKTFHPAAAIR